MRRKFDLEDLIARRQSGETWDSIGAAYGKTGDAARLFWKKRSTPTPAEPSAPVESHTETSADDVDPFAEPVRPAAAVDQDTGPERQNNQTPDDGASPLGEDAARAYLPLLFGAADAVAQGTAVWLLRRKLGSDVSTELMDQARSIATLTPTERMALEASLVSRLASVRLSPDEALTLTVVGIYAAKAIGVMTLAGGAASAPVLIVSGDDVAEAR